MVVRFCVPYDEWKMTAELSRLHLLPLGAALKL